MYGGQNTRSKTFRVRKFIISFERHNRSIKEKAESLGVAKSTITYILKDEECMREALNSFLDELKPLKNTKPSQELL